VRAAALELKVFNGLADIPRDAWDGLLQPDDNPFVSWTFLEALESSASAAPKRGWWPCHLTAWSDDRLIAAAPAYVKNDSAGDFSRDWGLADSAGRYGSSYYPKLVIGVPFSPVTGRRILTAAGVDRGEAARLLIDLARQLVRRSELGVVQVLYHSADELPLLVDAGLCSRVLVQYHWRNDGYSSFDHWLDALPSKKRTQIRRERRAPEAERISIRTVRADELRESPETWARRTFELYAANCEKHFWGGAYLNQRFYHRLFHAMPEAAEVVVAEREGRIIAGAFNVATGSHLFGRYWGCLEEHRFLHFNVCIYHSIAECIARGVQIFEGGAGGEHKLARGFDPVLVHTSYLLPDRALHEAVARYFAAETAQRRDEIDRYHEQRRGAAVERQ
jgi:predicted N-acyltransferase